MRDKIVLITSIILFGLNLLLIYSNIQRQQRINILNSQIKYYEREEAIHQFFKELLYVKNSFEPKEDLSLIIIFPITECASCLESEMNALNHFHKKFSDRTNVYFVGEDSLFLEHAGIEFSYETINSTSIILPNFFKIDNPLRIIVDKQNIIHGLYRFDVENSESRSKFYKKAHSLFESIE